MHDTRNAPAPYILTSVVPNALGESMCPTMFEASGQPKYRILNLFGAKLLLVRGLVKFIYIVAYF